MAASLQETSGFDLAPVVWLGSRKSPEEPLAAYLCEHPEMNFQVSTVRGSITTVLVLTGELDLATVREFESALVEAEKESLSIILDLSGLQFLDCSGLHSFVAAAQRIKKAGGELKLIAGPAHVQRLFSLTRVDTLFDFVENRATAL